ncbi:MAG: hypothetical protein ACYTFI_22935 [Planctomycetota bacterium]|jgi:hypothetical protein
MTQEKRIATAKVLAIAGFLMLLSATYYIRSEVLAINAIRFSADDLRAKRRQKEWEESYPERVAHYEAATKNYEARMKVYGELLGLYETDYDEYVARTAGVEPEAPQLPRKPSKPETPKRRNELMEINTRFVAQKHHYFASMRYFNWIAWLGAILFAGGVLYLLMFDKDGKKLFYFLALVLAFVFMIGPSFHSIMSAIVGLLEAPGF